MHFIGLNEYFTTAFHRLFMHLNGRNVKVLLKSRVKFARKDKPLYIWLRFNNKNKNK